MNAAVRAAIDAGLADLDRVMDAPVEPFGYGSDLSWAHDADPDMKELDGDDPLVLAQALVRRLDCPRGQLPDDASYGIDVREFLNEGRPVQEIASIEAQIGAELTKDDRVAKVVVRVTHAGSELAIRILVTPVDPASKAFRLTLAVTSATAILEAIEAAA